MHDQGAAIVPAVRELGDLPSLHTRGTGLRNHMRRCTCTMDDGSDVPEPAEVHGGAAHLQDGNGGPTAGSEPIVNVLHDTRRRIEPDAFKDLHSLIGSGRSELSVAESV